MWLGTADGLARYDGTNTCRYEHNPEDKNSLCHNSINVIVEDQRQRLWIGTAAGLCIYDREKDLFINVDSIAGNKNHLSNHYITALSFDQDGQVWIGTYGNGINIYNPTALSFRYLSDSIGGKNSATTNYLNCLLRIGDLMLCGTKGGLKLFNTIEKTPVPLTLANGDLSAAQVTQLVRDKVGNIWVATANGEIIKLTPGNGYYSLNKIFSGESVYGTGLSNILTLCLDNRGNLWFGGENSGLNYLDVKTNKVVRRLSEDGPSGKIPINSIRYVYVDDTGLTWIGTFNKGAYLIDNSARKFEHYRGGGYADSDLIGKDVRSFAEDRNGNIWIAFDGIGLAKLDVKTKELRRANFINSNLVNKVITALVCDRHDNLWIGTAGKGVFEVNLRTYAIKNFTLQSKGFGDDKVYSLYEDKNGTVWAGTSGSGLFYFDDETRGFVNLCEENKDNYITRTSYVSSMTEDSEGIFWVATMYGLYSLKRTTGNSFDYTWYLPDNKPGSVSSSGIQMVYEDDRKNLWIGTTDNGLNVKSKGSGAFTVFQKKDGLASNTVRAMVTDASGNLWISGNAGLSKFEPGTEKFTNYTRSDGLVSNNFYNNACLRSSTGELFFGSNNGFNAFYPDSIWTSPVNPVVYLTDLKLNNQSVPIGMPGSPLQKHISLTSSIKLSYDQRSFMIDFVAINYGPSFHHNYCYKLEGFDTDWNCVGPAHSATYTNLDPGHYVFVVKASNNDGIWSESPARLEITIRPALWKTWWAMAIYVVLLSATIFFLVSIRTERIKMKNQLALERVAREREHELSESKAQFFTNISHEFRTPLSLLLMPLESLVTGDQIPLAAKERIQTAYRNADKMMRLVNELMDFNKLESAGLKLNLQHGELVKFISDTASVFDDLARRRNISFRVKTEVPFLKGWFDRDKLEKILVNILSNAFKFTSDSGEISVIINATDVGTGEAANLCRCLQLIVIDNGIGISSEEIPHIFDKFYQAKSATKIQNPGTGIGLSLTKGLVELHHGSITAESTPDRVTKFTIILPIDSQAYDVETEINAPVDVVYTKADVQTENGLPQPGDVLNGSMDRSEILIVEDNDELREYLAAELRHEFNVLEAKDGQEGLAMAFEKSPHLIISDILMSQKTGIELCKAIKGDVKTSHIPVILLTAKATVDDQIMGIETGADLYITKPFSIRFLLTHVRNIIDSRQKLYSHFSQDVYLLPSKIATNQIDQAFLQKAIDHIVENIQNPQLGVDSIAALFNLSRVQVYRKIKALTGKTAVEFIRTVRLKQALKLMDTKKYTLSEIAYQTGFNSASYFTRSFKDEYGKAPSEYLEVGN